MGLLTGQYLFGDEEHPNILKHFINVGVMLEGFCALDYPDGS
jgi:hypothetical protein